MKLALLGADDESLRLIRWAVEQGGHELAAAFETGRFEAEVRTIEPRVRVGESWEALLLGAAVDAVVVGLDVIGNDAASGIDGAERRADQLRKLAQAAVPLIVVCPACESIVGFEIEMIRRDVGGVIVPVTPTTAHPVLPRLKILVDAGDDSPLGPIEQITLDREQADRSRGAVLLQLARDATLLRPLLDTIKSVTASGPSATIGRDPLGPKPPTPPTLTNLSITISDGLGLAARWSVLPGAGASHGRLTIIGQRGRAVLHMPPQDDWSLEVVGERQTREDFPAEFDRTAVFDLLGAPPEMRDTIWLDACRDQEVAEAVDRSLARGRTIELYGEEHTEADSFKGVMAMGGCLLLMLVLAVALAAALTEGLRLPIRTWPVVKMWPVCLLAPVALFLLLQLLQLAVRRPASAGAGENAGESK